MSPRRLRPLLAAALLAGVAGPALAQACSAWRLGLAAGAEHSRWQEHDSDGRRLLQEDGVLATLALDAGTRCAGLDWQATLAVAQGRRDYDGRSTTGVPLRTHSRIARQQLQLQALQPLAGDWSAGVRLAHQWLQRDLLGVGAVQGYDEHFTHWQAAAGLVLDRPAGAWAGAPLALRAGLWLGGGPPGRMRLHLPQADATTLRLGASRLVQLQLGLCEARSASACSATAASRWRVDLVWQQSQSGAGPATALRQQGVLVGGVAQPATRQRALGLQAALTW